MAAKRDNSYSHVLKYTGIFGGVQGINILIVLVRNKCVALLLGPAGMGLATLFNTTVNFILQATNLGISFSAVRNVSELYDSGDDARISEFIRTVRGWSLLTGLLGMLLCMVVGPLLDSTTFSWGNHTWHYVALSPLVAMMAVTGGETAILKGARRLRPLALIQLFNVIAALVVSVPVYFFFGASGIVPVMVLLGLVAMLVTMYYSYRLFPFRLGNRKSLVADGIDMVRLGIAFTLAGIIGSGAEFLIRSYLNQYADLDVVGLYNAGFVMTMTYAGVVFSALETDYFPRLSAVNSQVAKYNDLINKQAEVSLLLISPIIVSAMFLLPIVVPLLTSSAFSSVVDMMRVMTLALFFRAVNLPIEYLSLAKGASKSYLFLEIAYDVLMAFLVIMGYRLWGLTGTGIAILLATVLNSLLIVTYMGRRFQVRLRWGLVRIFLIQTGIGCGAFYASMLLSGAGYWAVGIVVSLLSLGVSVGILRSKTHLWRKLKARVARRFSNR